MTHEWRRFYDIPSVTEEDAKIYIGDPVATPATYRDWVRAVQDRAAEQTQQARGMRRRKGGY